MRVEKFELIIARQILCHHRLLWKHSFRVAIDSYYRFPFLISFKTFHRNTSITASTQKSIFTIITSATSNIRSCRIGPLRTITFRISLFHHIWKNATVVLSLCIKACTFMKMVLRRSQSTEMENSTTRLTNRSSTVIWSISSSCSATRYPTQIGRKSCWESIASTSAQKSITSSRITESKN